MNNNIPRISSELNRRINQEGFSVNSNGLSNQINQPSLNPRLKSWNQRQKCRNSIVGRYQDSKIALDNRPRHTQDFSKAIDSNNRTLNSARDTQSRYKFSEPKSRYGR